MRSERAIQLGDSCDVILVVLRHKLLSLLVLVESELDLLEDLTMDELIDVIVGGHPGEQEVDVPRTFRVTIGVAQIGAGGDALRHDRPILEYGLTMFYSKTAVDDQQDDMVTVPAQRVI